MNTESKPIPHRVVYSSWDFQQALSALTFLCEECDFDKKYSRIELRRFRCFETAAIVSFCRPFKVGHGRQDLDLTEIGFQFTKDEENLKAKIIRLRDKIVSHSDEEEMEYRTYSFNISEDSDIRMPASVFIESLYLNEEEYELFEQLLHRLTGAIAKYKFDFAQSNPELFEQLKTTGNAE